MFRKPFSPGPGWQPYSPGTRRYPDLTEALQRDLALVAPSRDRNIVYKPCRVELTDGSILESVYVQDAGAYISVWGVWPEDDAGKFGVDLTMVKRITDSPSRLPAHFAEQLYRAGESRMGGCIFTVCFSDGSRQTYETGGAVDFIPYPTGKGPHDVVAVLPHEGRGVETRLFGSKYHWCLYGTGTLESSGWRWRRDA
jgi:hypothetical protein